MTENGGLLKAEELDFLLEQETSADSPEQTAGASTEGQQISIRGNLEQIELADIFQTLAMSKLEGTLRVRTPVDAREVLFRDGSVRCYTPIRKETRKIGQRLIREGLLTAEELRPALLKQRERRVPLGLILVQDGIVSSEIIESMLRRQCADDLYALFTWKHGSFEFYKGKSLDPNTREQLEHLPDFDAHGVLLEVARRSDEWERINASLTSTDEVFVKTEVELPADAEQNVVVVHEAIDGSMSVRELADATMLGLFECARAMLTLHEIGAIEIVPIERLVELAKAQCEKGNPKRALVLVQTAHDRSSVEQSQEAVLAMVAILQQCGEPKLAATYLLEAAQRATKSSDTRDLARRARKLDPHSIPILEQLRVCLAGDGGPIDAEAQDEYVDVLGGLSDAYAETGEVEPALLCVEEIHRLQPQNQTNLMRKSKLLHKLGKTEEAVAVLLALAELLKSERRSERLGQVYEQILKIDFRRRDIARALKVLHAGPAYRLLKYGSIVASIVVLAGAGLLVQKRMAQNEQVELAAKRIQELLHGDKPDQAIAAIEKLALAIARSRTIEELRQRATALVTEREQALAAARRQTEASKLALAAEQVERGEFKAALATYSELVKGSADGSTSDPAVAAVLGKLVTRLEGLARTLPFLVPPAPSVVQNEAARTQALAELSSSFKEKDEIVASGVAKAESDPLLERWLSQELRTKLVASAKTVCEAFDVAKTRIKEYQAAQARVHSARRLEPLLVSAKEHESKFEFAKALEDYRKLTEEQTNDEELKRFFRDQVERFASIERFLGIVAKATSEGDFETAVGQLRALRRAYPDIPFDRLVELPLKVISLPAGATVKKNGVEVGKTPLSISYSPAKENKISVELEGFSSEEGPVKGDRVGVVRSQLVKLPAWSIVMPGVVERAPVLDEASGHAYVVDRSGTVSQLEVGSGTPGWRFPCADLSGLLTAPALAGKRLVVGSTDGPVRCLDVQGGTKVWEAPSLPSEATPRIAQDLAFVATTDGQVVALRMQDGTIAWRSPLPGPVHGAPALTATSLVLGTTNGHAVCVRIKDGAEAWKVKVADSGLTGPVVVGTGVILAAEEGSLMKLALEDGHRLWRQTNLGELTLQPVVTQTHVYLAEGKDVAVFAVADGAKSTPFTGDQLWSGDPALAGGSVVIGTRAGPVSVLDSAQLALRYRLAGAKPATAPPVSVGNDHVIVGFADKTLTSFRLMP